MVLFVVRGSGILEYSGSFQIEEHAPMRASVTILCFFTLTGSMLSAQQTTTDELGEDLFLPARPGEEGPERYESEPIDWQTAIPAQLIAAPEHELPEGFVHEAVHYNVETGRETRRVLDLSSEITESWVTGRALRSEVPEWRGGYQTFDSPTAVTSTAFPWSAQCRMFFAQTGGNFVCSGTLVDAKTMFTAGHCVHEGNGGLFSTNVTLSPAWDGDDDGFGSASSIDLYTYSGWSDSGNRDWDIGFVVFDRPVGFLTGWMGYGFDNDDSFFSGSTFNFAAYPGCNNGCFCNFANCPNQLYYGNGGFDTVTNFQLTANLTSWCFTGGMSGGGVYFIDGAGDRFVYGDNSSRATTGCTITSNTWTRMTQTSFDDLDTVIIPDAYPATLDLVPLDVNAPSSIRAGAVLSSLDYLVANASLANPPSDTYDADFYLSTNENISEFDTLIQNRSFTWDFAAKSSVRITSSANLPRIPQDTEPGDYWFGMILNTADFNTNNNDTDGWDAAPVTVLPKFPNLPSNTLFVGSSGVVIDFETTPLSYAASNRLDGDTLGFSSSAWVNYGNLGALSDPYRGTGSLELGNDPGSAAVTPDNVACFILKLNGQNGISFVMDFMLADHGEEADNCDGVWISQTGDTWFSLTPGGWGPLSPLGTGQWYSVRDMALTGATSVNTDSDFYLAFVAQDDFPYGAADGIGIDDIRIRTADTLTITVSNFVGGSTTQLHQSGGTPGSLGCVLYSRNGGGPIPTSIGTLLVTPPWVLLPCVTLDGNGAHTRTQPLPAALTGNPVWFQTLEFPAFALSNGLDLVVK